MTILKGPADASHYQVKVGQNRWYTDPLPGDDTWEATDWSGPSVSQVKGVKGFAAAEYVVMKRVAQHTDPLPKDVTARYEALKALNNTERERAFKRGAGVHSICESKWTGYIDTANADAEKYRSAVDAFFDTYQPEFVACEFVAMNRTLNGFGYGGAADLVARVEGGLYVIDWKSRGEESDHAIYPEEAAQITAYGLADYWIVEDDDGPKRMAPLELAGGLIVSIKPDGFRVYPVDLHKQLPYWHALHAFWVGSRDDKAGIGRAWAPRKIVGGGEPVPVASPVEQAPPAGGKRRTFGDEVRARTPDVPVLKEEPADPKAVEALKARHDKLPGDAKAWIDAIYTDAANAGHKLNPPDTVRKFEIARAMVRFATLDPDDRLLRGALEDFLGEIQMTIPLGKLIGELTIPQIETLNGIALAIHNGSRTVVYTAESAQLDAA